jgi:hypothetical protein
MLMRGTQIVPGGFEASGLGLCVRLYDIQSDAQSKAMFIVNLTSTDWLLFSSAVRSIVWSIDAIHHE